MKHYKKVQETNERELAKKMIDADIKMREFEKITGVQLRKINRMAQVYLDNMTPQQYMLKPHLHQMFTQLKSLKNIK